VKRVLTLRRKIKKNYALIQPSLSIRGYFAWQMTQKNQSTVRKPLPFSLLILGEATGLANLVHIFHSHDSEPEAVWDQKDEHTPVLKEPILEPDEELDPTQPIAARLTLNTAK
jgi:hypothetical protein